MSDPKQAELTRISTGVAGLDDVLEGGVPPRGMYLIMGGPGTGKTTLGMQFLMQGRDAGERCLFITLSENHDELERFAASRGWTLDGIELFDLNAAERQLASNSQNTLFNPAEVDLNETTDALLGRIDAVKPSRVVFDSLSELRLLSQDSLRYRRQLLALKQYFAKRDCTVLLLNDGANDRSSDVQLQSLSQGVIELFHLAPDYGAERRRLRVLKVRSIGFRGGYHDFTLGVEGLSVYPRLVAAEHKNDKDAGLISSGLPELDALLGGGVTRGSSALLLGPTGSGKSTLAIQVATAAAARGEHAALFMFDESADTALMRTDGMSIGLRQHVEAGRVSIRQIDPAELSPDAFTHEVRQSVERDKARVVVIDSLNGYINAMPDEKYLTLQMHELLTYLGQQGVLTILVVAHRGVVNDVSVDVPLDISYLADTALLLRYFEASGEIRQALSVIKKRSGPHERTIREFRMTNEGIKIGEPLREFRGIFSGIPTNQGEMKPLLTAQGESNGG